MTEIILLGTFHFPSGFDIFSDAVQQELDELTNTLAALKPTKIAVEFPQRHQKILDIFYNKFSSDRIKEETEYGSVILYGKESKLRSINEIVQVGFRLGGKLQLDRIHAIDEDIELSDALFEKIVPHISLNQIANELEQIDVAGKSLQEKYCIHNSKAYIHADHALYLTMNRVNLGNYEGSQLVLQWYERNLKIFSNLQNICCDSDRILVLIGSSHLKILQEFISASPNMQLWDTGI